MSHYEIPGRGKVQPSCHGFESILKSGFAKIAQGTFVTQEIIGALVSVRCRKKNSIPKGHSEHRELDLARSKAPFQWSKTRNSSKSTNLKSVTG
jgi:hypothetical protein